eukprot:TRINITY_DN5239_c0_g1_i4.p1 TRINITY_DN5239_c0_g1~~TRINITY_DN5239_c0_g1_i4.p1  ORF type:complete len:217 (-),score=57.47 TRINITY_DN5239_c0_g1_i4:352-1002(-)
MADFSWVIEHFDQIVMDSQDNLEVFGVIDTLTEVLKRSKAETMMGLMMDIKDATNLLIEEHNTNSVHSGSQLFRQYATRAWLDLEQNFQLLKSELIRTGEQFRINALASKQKIAHISSRFLRDGMKILTYGSSVEVIAIIEAALEQGKRLSVYVTETESSSPVYKFLMERNIPVTLMPISAAAYVMKDVDLVLVGAEVVVENGGIINTVHTLVLLY